MSPAVAGKLMVGIYPFLGPKRTSLTASLHAPTEELLWLQPRIQGYGYDDVIQLVVGSGV